MHSGSLRPLRFPLSIPVLSFLRFPFSARRFVSQALHNRRPPVSSSAAPLAFALGSGYLALSFRVLVPRSDLTYISTATSNCQHLFFIFFNYYLVNCYHFMFLHQKPSLQTLCSSDIPSLKTTQGSAYHSDSSKIGILRLYLPFATINSIYTRKIYSPFYRTKRR